MKRQLITIFLFALLLVVPAAAQKLITSDLKNILFSSCHNCVDELDSLIRRYGEEKVLNALVQIPINQDNSPVIPDSNSKRNINGIWYLLTYTYKDQFPTVVEDTERKDRPNYRNFIETHNLYISNRMKLIYWAWLIYSDSVKTTKLLRDNSQMHLLVDSTGLSLLDYVNTGTHFRWHLSTFQRETAGWVIEMDSTFESWKTMLKKKGLRYLRKNKISPVNLPYKYNTVKQGFYMNKNNSFFNKK